MSLGYRTIFWVGPMPYLIRVRDAFGAPRVQWIEPAPFLPAFTTGMDWEVLGPWLAEKCRPGQTVDVLYQNHMLRLETFPTLAREDFAGAVRLRLERVLLPAQNELRSLASRLDAPAATQAVFAAHLDSRHASVLRGLALGKLVPGRIGFAGQLALRALHLAAPRGGWTVVESLAFTPRLVLAVDPSGFSVATRYAGPPEQTADAAASIVKVHLPKLDASSGPIDLTDAPGASSLRGLALPAPLSFVLPVFLREAAWRIPSLEDSEYPYYLGKTTWAFAAVMAMALAWTAQLRLELGDINRVSEALTKLQERKAELSALQARDEALQSSLERLDVHVRGVGAELFDNASWLSFVGGVRDRLAPGLLFEKLSLQSESMTLSGVHDTAAPVLAFLSGLTQALGEQSVRLLGINRETSGRQRFAVEIVRMASVAPGRDDKPHHLTPPAPDSAAIRQER